MAEALNREGFKDGLEHLPLSERIATRAQSVAELAAKITGQMPPGQTELDHLVADRDLLLWLHAEAGWQRDQAELETARATNTWRSIAEQWERGHNEDVLPYTAKLEADRDLLLWLEAEAMWLARREQENAEHLLVEIDRLRREVEFEANAVDLSGRAPDGHGYVNGACQCECGEPFTTLGEWQQHCKAFAVCACSIDVAALDPERWSRPLCVVHPDGQDMDPALREQLHEDELSLCDGSYECEADVHVDGCYSADAESPLHPSHPHYQGVVSPEGDTP